MPGPTLSGPASSSAPAGLLRIALEDQPKAGQCEIGVVVGNGFGLTDHHGRQTTGRYYCSHRTGFFDDPIDETIDRVVIVVRNEETGEEIGLKRLEARPVATLCLEAQERREMAERQFRDRDDRYR